MSGGDDAALCLEQSFQAGRAYFKNGLPPGSNNVGFSLWVSAGGDCIVLGHARVLAGRRGAGGGSSRCLLSCLGGANGGGVEPFEVWSKVGARERGVVCFRGVVPLSWTQ